MTVLELLAAGVLGYTVEEDDELYIPVIMAVEEGSGDVGRYLDALPKDRTVKVPEVASERLRGMLERRGFNPTPEFAEEFGETVEVFVRWAA